MESLDQILSTQLVIEIGEITIRPLDEFTVWLEHESGVGAAVEKKILGPLLVTALEENL